MNQLPENPIARHNRFIEALCSDWQEAGTVTRNTPRADAVLEISRQTRPRKEGSDQ
jgi:hypothetical protein